MHSEGFAWSEKEGGCPDGRLYRCAWFWEEARVAMTMADPFDDNDCFITCLCKAR